MSSHEDTPIIDVSHIRRAYTAEGTETVAIQDISLRIEQGEFVSIKGKSGSGKSTLLHILGFLDQPSSGSYKLRGRDTTTFTPEQLAHIRNSEVGFVFQSFHLLPRQTVVENVMLPLVYSSIPPKQHRAQAEQALAQVDMSHRLNHFPPQLSGGEKQRVAIARALVNNANIIFADEPTGNLDTKTGELVMHTIAKLHQAGHTIILVTHESSTASFANRIIELEDGKVLHDDANQEVHTKYHK